MEKKMDNEMEAAAYMEFTLQVNTYQLQKSQHTYSTVTFQIFQGACNLNPKAEAPNPEPLALDQKP